MKLSSWKLKRNNEENHDLGKVVLDDLKHADKILFEFTGENGLKQILFIQISNGELHLKAEEFACIKPSTDCDYMAIIKDRN